MLHDNNIKIHQSVILLNRIITAVHVVTVLVILIVHTVHVLSTDKPNSFDS